MTIVAYVCYKMVNGRSFYLDPLYRKTSLLSRAKPFTKEEAEKFCCRAFDGGWCFELKEIHKGGYDGL